MKQYDVGTGKSVGLSTKFVDLAPVSDADEAGIYFEALKFATNNPNVSNIALTGPYGSGKSSVIKSFLTKYRRPALEISLASFLPEAEDAGGKVSKQEIERSILQQMLYGADADKLPLSRFKRIQSPKQWSGVSSLLTIFGGFSIWYLFLKRSEILSGEFFTPFELTNWFNLGCFAFGFAFLWLSLHRLYIKSYGLSLKGISLKDVEIVPDVAEEDSILNRHLDEIIYFFQSTSYDLVIVEDLDRFDNPDIFVTLREINGLINANAGVKRQVRFLYALRDDIFVNTDRTKFFEFIVPIVPIINHSNSIDKVLEQGQRLSLGERLDAQFLREVSQYLNDLRLIHNTFNEYAIYVANLETDGDGILDPNKLLAVLIYKNVLPSDFEELHQQKGVLAQILSRHDEFMSEVEARYKLELSNTEAELVAAERELSKDITELKRIYAMAIVERIPQNFSMFSLNNSSFIPISKLSDHEQFSKIINTANLTIRTMQGHNQQLDISKLQFEVDPNKTFEERSANVERKSAKFKESASGKIRDLKSKITTLRTEKFNTILRANMHQVEDCFEKFGESKDLMKFLILEGYLDDTYYQYVSLFHAGRLSPNDNKFLRQIRSFSTPDPDFQIDNPAEVAAAMRDVDFDQSYVLNRHLVDFLLENIEKHKTYIAKAIGFISSNFDHCGSFFSSYYERGAHVPELITSLIDQWPDFAHVASESEQRVSHISRIVAYAPEELLVDSPYADSDVSACFSSAAAEVLSEQVEFNLSRLKLLDVEVVDLPSIEEFPEVVDFLIEESLYKVSAENIQFVFERSLGLSEPSALETKHYTTVLKSESPPLLECIESDFSRYVQHVLLPMDSNTKEEVSTILTALKHEEVPTELLEEFWAMQSAIVPSLADVPDRFHPAALENQLIESSWDNCLTFLSSKSYSAELLTEYLQNNQILRTLSASTVPASDEAFELRKYLIYNDSFGDDVYRIYVKQLPKLFEQFPADISLGKIKILIEEKRVTFSVQSFEFLDEHHELQVLFVAQNINAYLKASSDYIVDDEFRMDLLSSDISLDQKRTIVRDIDPTFVLNDTKRASIVGPILDQTTFEVSDLGFEFLQSIIINSSTVAVQISLFNKCQEAFSKEKIRTILEQLPAPYSDIAIYRKLPRIANTSENRLFVEWLEQREIISSSKITYSKKDIQIYTFRGPVSEKPD